MSKERAKYSSKPSFMGGLTKYATLFLGSSLLAFGTLKFLPHFKRSYTSEIVLSGIPRYLYWPGQLSEILAGILLLFTVIQSKKTGRRNYGLFAMTGNLLVISIMTVAVIVHMNPNVPASVLPARIKPPYIPSLFFILACLNIVYMFRSANPSPDGETNLPLIK